MVKKNIVFVSFDEEYVSTIEYKFAKLIDGKANVEFITNESIFTRLKMVPKKIDILIIPEGVILEHPEAYAKTRIFYLTDTKKDDENSNYIYKYYSVKSIVEKIDIGLITNTVEDDSKGTKVVSVFSVSGGAGNTLSALSLAKKLQQKGKRVLYISTVSHQDFTYYLNCNDVLGTAFCYQCTINIKNALKIVLNEIKNDGFDYLPPFKNLPISYQIKFSMYAQIVAYIKQKNIYDYIVVEISPELELDKLAFLKESDRTVIITTQDKVAVRKLEVFLDYMLDFNQNIILVCNRYKRERTDYLSGSSILRMYEFSEFIEEFSYDLDLDIINKTCLFDKTTLCIE